MKKEILIALVAAFLIAFLLAFGMMQAQAAGIEYTGPTKTVNCTDAVERTDGTPLAPDEIAKVEVYIRPGDETASPVHTVVMPGGCQPMTLNLTVLDEGQYYSNGVTFDTEGRTSEVSVALPFVYRLANPLPPVMTE